MVRFMATKWSEGADSKREGRLVYNTGARTSLTSPTMSFTLKGQNRAVRGEVTLTVNDESQAPFSASFSLFMFKAS